MRIEQVAYHRNGVAGQPFVVAIVRDWADDGEHRFLVTVAYDERPEFADAERLDEATCRVLDLDMACGGNIHMHPQGNHPGGNAWRGDRLGAQWLDAIKAALDAQIAGNINRWVEDIKTQQGRSNDS